MTRRVRCSEHGLQPPPCPICAALDSLAARAVTAETLLAWAQASRLRWRDDALYLRRGHGTRHPPAEEIPDALVTPEERRATLIAAKRAELTAVHAAHEHRQRADEWREGMDDLCGIDRGRLTSWDTEAEARRQAEAEHEEETTIRRLRAELMALEAAQNAAGGER